MAPTKHIISGIGTEAEMDPTNCSETEFLAITKCIPESLMSWIGLFRSVREVSINHSSLSSEDIAAIAFPIHIESVDLSHNGLREIGNWSGYNLLLTLTLSHNGIRDSPTAALPLRLVSLDLSENEVTRFPPVESCPFLDHVSVARNRIASLPTRLPRYIRSLDMSGNRIEAIPSYDPPLLRMEILDISGNPVSCDGELSTSMPNLIELYIDCSSEEERKYLTVRTLKKLNSRTVAKTDKILQEFNYTHIMSLFTLMSVYSPTCPSGYWYMLRLRRLHSLALLRARRRGHP